MEDVVNGLKKENEEKRKYYIIIWFIAEAVIV